MAVLRTNIIPKCKGCVPRASPMGAKTGAKIRMETIPGVIHPINKRIKLRMSKIRILLCVIDHMSATICWGICSTVMAHEKATLVGMRKVATAITMVEFKIIE